MDNKPNYNPKDKNSVIGYAKLLKGKTLRQTCDPKILEHSYTGKGNLGQILEKFYFGYNPNSKSEADFFEIGIELKTSPLKQLKNKEFRSKERLVLNIINYNKVVNQQFEDSDFWKKNAQLLLVFYMHQAEIDVLDYVMRLVDVWNFPKADLLIIRKDWELIKQKIIEGNAHQLSEGDTFYLGACTKGASSKSVRKQPCSEVLAKQRAYSLKQGYVNHIVASIANEPTEIYGKLLSSCEIEKTPTIEEIVISKFSSFYNQSIADISASLGVEINIKAKNAYATLTKAILGIGVELQIEEFEKAEIKVKSIRIEADDSIVQSVSFPAFEFTKVYEENWLTSDLCRLLESKFLFIFFKKSGAEYLLQSVKFWNMPYSDRIEARKVWLKAKKVIQSGRIVAAIRTDKLGREIRYNNFPKISENGVAHVRPHGKDSNDTYPLPVPEASTGAKEYTKQCFWLNNTYVSKEIFLK